MVSMSTVDELISYILALPHLLANLAVLFISIRYVKPCAVRIYAFNLTIPSLVYSIYSLAMVIMKLSGGGRSFGVRDNKANTDFFDYLGTVVAYLCGYDYRMLAIVLVGVTFTAFAKPLYAKNILTDRTILCCFLLAHLAAVCLSTVSAFSSKQVQNLFLHGIHIKVDWTDYAEGIAEFGSFLTFVVLYVVCIREIVKFNNKQKLFHHNTRDQQVLKKQLLAILFYITPPTTFLIPYSLCTDISTTFIPSSTAVYKQICSIKINFYGSLIAIRYFVASFTILIAFSDYRRVLLAKIFKTVPIFRGNANMVQSSSYM